MKSLLTFALVLAIGSAAGAQAPNYAILKTFHIQSGGGWDYLAVSPFSPNIYVSHGTQVNILNKMTGDSVGVITGTIGVHGIAFAPEFNKGFISNGRLGNVFVFNAKTNVVTDSIRTGENPDAVCYDPFSKKLVVGNGRSNDLTIIDAATNKVVATVPLGGKPEASVSSEDGRVFINIEDKNEVVVLDMKTLKINRHYPLASGTEPSGLAIDRKGHVLYVGCGNGTLVMLNTGGALMKTYTIGDHCDGTAFDNGIVYASCGDGTLSVLRYIGNDVDYSTETISTKRGARTIAIDPATHLMYLPAADFEPQPEGSKERPKMIPGTFEVLVIGRRK